MNSLSIPNKATFAVLLGGQYAWLVGPQYVAMFLSAQLVIFAPHMALKAGAMAMFALVVVSIVVLAFVVASRERWVSPDLPYSGPPFDNRQVEDEIREVMDEQETAATEWGKGD